MAEISPNREHWGAHSERRLASREGKKVGRTTSPRAAEISRAIAILVIASTPALAFVSYFTGGQ
jgi:hypothetical protein